MPKFALKRDGEIVEMWADTRPSGAVPWPTVPEGQTVLDVVNGQPVVGTRPLPPGTQEQVRAEALRRIDAIADTRTRDQLIQRALRLIMKVTIEGETLSASDQAEIAAGQSVTDQIEVIQAAEQALLAMDPIPGDYADDKWWTA